MGRILALDYGSKRIGVAISDEEQKIAFPRPFISGEKQSDLLELMAREAVETVVVGLPKSLAGKETQSTRAAREFAHWLRQNSPARIEFADERFTTRQAQQKLRAAGLKSKNSKTKIDGMSAQIILQTYLNSLPHLEPFP